MHPLPLPLHQFEYRLALALALGALLGLERQVHHKAAGTKTHALVALGAALFVLLAEGIAGDAAATGRVVGQIITGIGFLGAGAILRRDSTTVTGLTTAATVWCAGAIGTLAGLGSWYQAVVGTGFILVANVLLRPLDLFINRVVSQPKASRRHALPPVEGLTYLLRVALRPAASGDELTKVLDLLLAHQPALLVVEPPALPAGPLLVRAELQLLASALGPLLSALQALPGVAQVEGERKPASPLPDAGVD